MVITQFALSLVCYKAARAVRKEHASGMYEVDLVSEPTI